MVGDVAAGAVSGDEAPAKIGVVRWVFVNVFEDVESVVVRRRKAMFRREVVVDGDDDGWDFSGEAAAEVVEELRAGEEQQEPATVDVDDEGKLPTVVSEIH